MRSHICQIKCFPALDLFLVPTSALASCTKEHLYHPTPTAKTRYVQRSQFCRKHGPRLRHYVSRKQSISQSVASMRHKCPSKLCFWAFPVLIKLDSSSINAESLDILSVQLPMGHRLLLLAPYHHHIGLNTKRRNAILSLNNKRACCWAVMSVFKSIQSWDDFPFVSPLLFTSFFFPSCASYKDDYHVELPPREFLCNLSKRYQVWVFYDRLRSCTMHCRCRALDLLVFVCFANLFSGPFVDSFLFLKFIYFFAVLVLFSFPLVGILLLPRALLIKKMHGALATADHWNCADTHLPRPPVQLRNDCSSAHETWGGKWQWPPT